MGDRQYREITIRLEKTWALELDQIAEQNKISVSDLTTQIMRQFIGNMLNSSLNNDGDMKIQDVNKSFEKGMPVIDSDDIKPMSETPGWAEVLKPERN